MPASGLIYRFLTALLIFTASLPSIAQTSPPNYDQSYYKVKLDSINTVLKNAKTDSDRYINLVLAGDLLGPLQPWTDSSLRSYQRAYEIADKNNQQLAAIYALVNVAWTKIFSNQHLEGYTTALECLELANSLKSYENSWTCYGLNPEQFRGRTLSYIHRSLGHFKGDVLGNQQERFSHFYEARKFANLSNDPFTMSEVESSLTWAYNGGLKYDSALLTGLSGEKHTHVSPLTYWLPFITKDIAVAYWNLGKKDSAFMYIWKGIHIASAQKNMVPLVENYYNIDTFYLAQKNKDSALHYAKKALEYTKLLTYNPSAPPYFVYELMASSYALYDQQDSVNKYLKIALGLRQKTADEMLHLQQEVVRNSFEKQMQLQKLEKQKLEDRGRLKTYSILGLILVFSTIGYLLYRNNREKQKTNHALQEKNRQIENAFDHLKTTQAQLIQSEKMASLGELTAGIAHEIKNPLNFVNNFSDINTELCVELKNALKDGQLSEAEEIANNVHDNEVKINHHGKRADAIVKSMLQHSHRSSSTKEPSDINALAEEFLRLAYHSFRAKDKSFQAQFHTSLDPEIGTIEVVRQDISRVLLNLFNNAFYAVNEKSKSGAGFEPKVHLTTKKAVDEIMITIKDNGNGIPPSTLKKIFQPFFTTKPTGEGTGLGLSLSYDIIKAHGGEIRVETKEGEGSEFTIVLPVNS